MSATRSLSPSRAGDFMTCPLLFRFRTIDRLPERPSDAAVRGTVVHRVLEMLLDPDRVGLADRRLERAIALLDPALDDVLAQEPATAVLFAEDPDTWQRFLDGTAPPDPTPEQRVRWLEPAHALLATYFGLEDPRTLDPARVHQEREVHVSATLDSGLVLRGIIDRLDRAPGGHLRVVDYKTGRSPREAFEQKALFQMRFYALALWRMRGVVPHRLQLMYLGDGQVLRHDPEQAELLATQRKVEAIAAAIDRAEAAGDWRASPSRLCDWCSHRAICPAWGGTPPPLPARSDPDEDTDAATGSDDAPDAVAQGLG